MLKQECVIQGVLKHYRSPLAMWSVRALGEEAGTAEYSAMEEVTRFDHDGDTFVLFLLSKPSAGHSEGFGQDQGRKKKEIKRAAKKKLKAAAKTKGTNDAGFLAPSSGAYVAPLESTAASSASASRQAPALQEAEAEHDEVYPSLQRSLPEHEVGDKLQASFQGVYQLDEDTRVPQTPVADEAAGHHNRMRLCSVPSATDIVVLDRTREDGAIGCPLFLDVNATYSLIGEKKNIVGGQYGL